MQNKLIVGQKIFFMGESLPMEVKAVSNRYAIATRDFDKIEDEGHLDYAVETQAYSNHEEAYEAYKDEVVYTLLDFQENMKAPNDLVFNPYDYRDHTDIDECLADLETGDVFLSRRHGEVLNIDWEKSINSLELELQRAKNLKGKKLNKNEIFLIEQFWNDKNYILKLYEGHGVGYKHVNDSCGD